MSKVLVTDTSLSAIAAAIRQKNGESTRYKPGEMAEAISNLPSGAVVEPLTVTKNGTYTPSQGADGFSTVLVNVESQGFAFVTVKYNAGDVPTATDGIATLTGDNSGEYVFLLPNGGDWAFAAGGKTKTLSINQKGSAHVVNLGLEIVSWADGTDEQIAAMVEAMDAGALSVEDSGWQIGDERVVQLAAMAATGVGESHAAQSVTLVLMDSGKFDLVGGGKDHFVVGQKHSLNEAGYMNSSNTNSGSWDGCARRTWCNNVYRNAIPATLRGCFKQFNVITAESYNGSTNKISKDYFALFAEQEIFGSRSYSNTTEAAALTQIEWYKNANNRKKNRSGSSGTWWERSPFPSDSNCFCRVYLDGSADYRNASDAIGLAPFGCI
jgi:hypothetical protein